ncbi:MAG: type II secretion system F family protein [Planctomycetaceae bacterium]|jgi:type IV pilus assembly protein PilC|nr:type II secretion system F family protein [Planctomycetaceae bacterium]
MPRFKFEAIDQTGRVIKDVTDEVASEEEAQATIRQMGYVITKIVLYKERKAKNAAKKATGKTFSLGRVRSKHLTTFTRQLSILQDAGLPILRSLNILMEQSKPGALRNSLIDVCAEIESGSSLSEAMAKCPKAFNRLFVNMIKAGEAGGALETILQRLAEFLESSERLKKKIISALTYPVAVVFFATIIVIFIMLWIVPQFQKIFDDFGVDLPFITRALIAATDFIRDFWFLLPGIPLGIFLFVKLTTSFAYGRHGFNLFCLRIPIFGMLVEKTIVARTMRTLGTLVTSGVPILEAIHITRETSNNAVFEIMFQKVLEGIRDGDTIANPMKMNCTPAFHPGALFFFFCFMAGPIGMLWYMMRIRAKILDDMVINMVDVGEQTGELDTMLYKVADVYEEEVEAITEGLMSLLEPLLVIFLGGIVGTIVVAMFMPLIALITDLSSSK